MAVHRFQIASNKKAALLKQNKREIASLLSMTPLPKEEKARIRAEAVIRDDYTGKLNNAFLVIVFHS